MLWLKTCGCGLEHGHERLLLAAEEVGREHLDARRRAAPAQRADGVRPVLGAAVVEVVAVDGRDDDVAAGPCARRRPRPCAGSSGSSGSPRLARVDGAVAAGARARVAHDLERRGAAAPALADVRAARLLADRVQAAARGRFGQLVVARPRCEGARTASRAAARARSGSRASGLRRSRSGGRRGRRSPANRSRRRPSTSPRKRTPRPTSSPTKPSKSSISSARDAGLLDPARPRSRALAPPSTRSSSPSRRAKPSSPSPRASMPSGRRRRPARSRVGREDRDARARSRDRDLLEPAGRARRRARADDRAAPRSRHVAAGLARDARDGEASRPQARKSANASRSQRR